jgi:hypothetical protein
MIRRFLLGIQEARKEELLLISLEEESPKAGEKRFFIAQNNTQDSLSQTDVK